MFSALYGRTLRKAAIASGFGVLGALSGFAPPSWRGCGAILTMHHVRPASRDAFAPNRHLEITPEFLELLIRTIQEAGFDLVPLDDAVARLESGTAPKGRPFAVLTLDDGYRDNGTWAVPILRREGVPYTLFIAANFADGVGRLWWDELEAAVRILPAIDAIVGGERVVLPAATPAEKQTAFDALYWRLRARPEAELLDAIANLADRAGVERAGMVAAACLTWDEIAALADDPLCTIGAHTLSHPRLAKLDAGEARREMAESRARIEQRLGRPIRHFAYPVGDPTSAGAREFAMARELGFVSAVTMRPGMIFPAHAQYPTALPRVSVNGGWQTRSAIETLLSGAPFWAWNRGRPLNIG